MKDTGQPSTRRHRDAETNGAAIGVGRNDWVQFPLPPNRTGESPASGSPVEKSPMSGLTRGGVGLRQRKQPMLRKEVHRPPSIVQPASVDPKAGTFAQQAPQTRPDPGIETFEGPVAVFEIRKPAHQRAIEVRHADRDAR